MCDDGRLIDKLIDEAEDRLLNELYEKARTELPVYIMPDTEVMPGGDFLRKEDVLDLLR